MPGVRRDTVASRECDDAPTSSQSINMCATFASDRAKILNFRGYFQSLAPNVCNVEAHHRTHPRPQASGHVSNGL